MKNRERDIDSIQKIICYCEEADSLLERCHRDFETYRNDILFQYACNMCVMQIGELVGRLSDNCLEKYSEIPWHAIRAMRNLHAHEYEKINLDIVWATLTTRLPELKGQMEKILEEL